MSPAEVPDLSPLLDLVPLEQLVAAIVRRLDPRPVLQITYVPPASGNERTRARWRRAQAARRARLRAAKGNA